MNFIENITQSLVILFISRKELVNDEFGTHALILFWCCPEMVRV